MSFSVRDKLQRALAGKSVDGPVYVAYDSFIDNYKKIDWNKFLDLGLGRVNHARILECQMPNLDIIESNSFVEGHERKKVRWITDIGELTETYMDGWQQEYFIKEPNDYKIMQRALTGVKFKATDKYFDQAERQLGDRGITLGQLGRFDLPGYNRTPFQVIQIDFVGLERFCIDLMTGTLELFELLEMMNEQFLNIFRCILKTKAEHIKLWENLSLETMGPPLYRKHLVPLYKKIFDILQGTNKKLHVHYDGQLSGIANDIKELPFFGIDSLTPPPEGDMMVAEARKYWPEKFLWIHPSLSWFLLDEKELILKIKETVKQAQGRRFCLQISEDVPPNCDRTIPLILETLQNSK